MIVWMGIAFDTSRRVDVLLERDDALAELHNALSGSRSGQGTALFISGEAGVGKTSLVKAFCAEVDPRTRVLVGACDALSTPRPLGPLLDLAEEGDALFDLVRLSASPSDVFAALVELLAHTPTILLIEDIHWADEATLDVLRLLVRRVETLPVLVVVTHRDDQLGRAHPMRILLGDLANAGAVSRVHLDALSADGIAQLALGHAVDPVELHRRTGGNPFFATEVLASGSATVPTTVRDAVLGRTAVLGQTEMGVLEVIALAPPRAEPWLVEAVVGYDLDGLDACLDTGLVADGGGALAFRHELARIAVEEATPTTRRRALHGQILAALAAQPEGERDHARLAHHADGAGDAAAVQAFAPLAATRAAAVGAYREAAAQYARALRFDAGLSPGARAALLEGRSRACYYADDQVEAIAVIRQAIECRRTEGAPENRARALAELSSYLSCRGLYTEAHEVIAEAADLIAGRREGCAVAWVLHAQARFSDDPPARVLDRAREAVAVAERCGDEEVIAETKVTLGRLELAVDFNTGSSTLAAVIDESDAPSDAPQAIARALTALGAWSRELGRPELGSMYMARTLEYCEARSLDLWRINVLAMIAAAALEEGRWTDAAEAASRVLEDPRESPWPHAQALFALALVRARRGDPDARVPLDEAFGLEIPAEDIETLDARAAAHAEIAWLERRLDEIDAATAASFVAAVARNDTPSICKLGYWRSLAGLEVDVPQDAEGPLALCMAGAWEEAAVEWARLGRPYEAALALAETGEEDALRQAHDDLQRLGALPAARLVSQRLRTLGVRGLARGPRASTRESAAGLTARELDVLALLADGLRNTQIAERLVVSPRTVDHHVSAILRKLEAGTRGEAVARAGELGLLAA